MAPTTNPDAHLFGSALTVDRPGMIAIAWFNFSYATAFLCLRLTVRWRQNRSFLADDYWMIWAWLCLFTTLFLQMQNMNSLWYLTNYNAEVIPHTPENNAEVVTQTEQWKRWDFPFNYLYWTTLWSVKASLLTTFYRLVKPLPLLRKCWYFVTVFVFVAYIAGWVLGLTSCPDGSMSDFFEADKCQSGKDVERGRVTYLYATCADITTDLLIMALPISMLPSLQLDMRKKIGLSVAFSLAIITICFAVVRFTQSLKSEGVDLVGLSLYTTVEAAVAVLVGSLPPLKALLARGISRGIFDFVSRKKAAGQKYISGSRSLGSGSAALENNSRTVIIAESIPLDDSHTSKHTDGGIYVHKVCETRSVVNSRGGGEENHEATTKGIVV